MKIIRREDITKKGSIKYFDVHALCRTIEKMPKYSNDHKRIYVGHTSNDTYPIEVINNPCVLSPGSECEEDINWIAFYSREGGEIRINVNVENGSEYYIYDEDWTNDDTIKPINLSEFIKEKTHYTYEFCDKNDEDGILIPGDIIRLTLVDIISNLQRVYGIILGYNSDEMKIEFVDPSMVEKWKRTRVSPVTDKIYISADNIWKPDVKEFEIERLHR